MELDWTQAEKPKKHYSGHIDVTVEECDIILLRKKCVQLEKKWKCQQKTKLVGDKLLWAL